MGYVYMSDVVNTIVELSLFLPPLYYLLHKIFIFLSLCIQMIYEQYEEGEYEEGEEEEMFDSSFASECLSTTARPGSVVTGGSSIYCR